MPQNLTPCDTPFRTARGREGGEYAPSPKDLDDEAQELLEAHANTIPTFRTAGGEEGGEQGRVDQRDRVL